MAVGGPPKRRKIAVLGSRSVGKSSLILQYIENHFVDNYYPTIESTFQKSVTYQGTEYDCEIIDTAGQDEFSILSSKHAIGIHGYIFVYSVTSRNSFNMVQIIHDKIVDFCGTTDVGIPCVIVGSKTDLQASRQIDQAEGVKLAQKLKGSYVETSAKSNTNVDRVFQLCIEEIEKHHAPPKPSSKPDEQSTGSCQVM